MPTSVYAWETSLAAEHHFRIGMPFPQLDPARFTTARGGPGPELHDYDVVFAQRLAGHSPEWLALCADPNVLTIYDMDDDLLCVDPENAFCYNIFHPLEEGTRANVLAADVVTVSSPGLLERYSKIHPHVVMLPICIPDWMLLDPIPERDLIVGWAGSMFKSQDWGAPGFRDGLVQYSRLRPDVHFEVRGADYVKGMLGAQCTIQPFVGIHEYYKNINFSVGLAPLFHSEFNLGKCHTKLIEYGSRGVPTIASAVGQYTEWIEHGVNGFLVEKPEDWLTYLLELSNYQLRASMSKAAYETASQWTMSKHIHTWEEVFEGKI